MRASNEFWLCLHELARAIDSEGRSDEERRANIVASLAEMPQIARTQVMNELIELLTFLPDLYPHVVTAVPKQQQQGSDQQSRQQQQDSGRGGQQMGQGKDRDPQKR